MTKRIHVTGVLFIVSGLVGAVVPQASAGEHSEMAKMPMGGADMAQPMMGKGLMIPSMNAESGRKLFASKGCVVCHSVNGIGGEDAPPMDASTMATVMNPFEFAARMWRGADAMIYMQREELGEKIELSGDELADIIAFTHDLGEQKKFTEADIPARVLELMEHLDAEDVDEHREDKKE